MGNDLSQPECHALANSVVDVLSNGQNHNALRAGLHAVAAQLLPQIGSSSSNTSPLAVKATGKKHQCRWCIETFPRKYNKDRHEGRIHPLELAEAKTASSARGVGSDTSSTSGDSEMELGDDDSSADVVDDRGAHTNDHPARASSASMTSGATPLHGPSHAESVEQADGEPSSALEQWIMEGEAIDDELDEVQKVLESGTLFPTAVRQSLDAADVHIAACCTPFLGWLCASAVTETERTVKPRRVDPKALAPVKKNLAFIIKALVGVGAVEAHQVKLEIFTQEKICKQYNAFLKERQVGPSRTYILFLLIKKILVFLASSESARRREYILPTTWNSWTCVDLICSDSNARRKQISRNRRLLGAEQCNRLEPAPTLGLPSADDLRMPSLFGETKKRKRPTAQQPPIALAHGGSATSIAQRSIVPVDANEMSPSELKRITQGCLDYLQVRPQTAVDGARFVQYLATGLLCLSMAPRQQVLRQLQIGSSFVKKEDGRWWILLLAHMNKNGRATMFPVAPELTTVLDWYITTLRPKLMGGKVHNFLFCKRNGDAPGDTFDFSDWTRSVSKELLGPARPINCHAFRAAVVTSYYKSGASQSEMCALADVMAHDFTTQQAYYFKNDAEEQALEVQKRMRNVFGLPVSIPHDPEADNAQLIPLQQAPLELDPPQIAESEAPNSN